MATIWTKSVSVLSSFCPLLVVFSGYWIRSGRGCGNSESAGFWLNLGLSCYWECS